MNERACESQSAIECVSCKKVHNKNDTDNNNNNTTGSKNQNQRFFTELFRVENIQQIHRLRNMIDVHCAGNNQMRQPLY